MAIGIPADDDGFSPPCWVIELLDGSKERIEVDKQDSRPCPMPEARERVCGVFIAGKRMAAAPIGSFLVRAVVSRDIVHAG